MKISLVSAAAAVALVAGVASAQASCGDYTILKNSQQHFIRMPALPRISTMRPGGSSIVGMWQISYTSGGNLVYQAIEQWHSDRTEWEFADIPVLSGNVCMGVWSSEGRRISLYHTGWTFDSSGNPYGTMQLTHKDKVARDGNSFSGTFDLKFFDGEGNLVSEVSGDDNGTRIPAP
ncbi:MAG: hypothetical protein ACREHF_14355 [Rhizomicrobium sp.]